MKTADIISKIHNSKRKSNGVMYLKTIKPIFFPYPYFGNKDLYIIFGDKSLFQEILDKYHQSVINYHIVYTSVNQALPLLDYQNITNARIEPGAIIRDNVKIGNNAIILMGAVINTCAEIGSETMIDMNAVVGANAKIGSMVHVGAGSVISGVLEPFSKNPVIIKDKAMIGANATILEGVIIGYNAVVGAGAVCIKDVEDNEVVGGVPAVHIKYRDDSTDQKTIMIQDLR